jgi:hypothetical protein
MIQNRETVRRDFRFRLRVWYDRIIALTRISRSTIICPTVSPFPGSGSYIPVAKYSSRWRKEWSLQC